MRFLLRDAVAAYESVQCGFIIVARKTARRVEQVKGGIVAAVATDRRRRRVRVLVSAGWVGKAYQFLALRYEKQAKVGVADTGSNTNGSRPRSTSTGCL